MNWTWGEFTVIWIEFSIVNYFLLSALLDKDDE